MGEYDLKTFNNLFTEYQQRFILFANSYVRDRVVAEDITTEAMIYYWENRHTMAENSNIPAFILTIIKRKCLNHLHRMQISDSINERLKEHMTWELSTRVASLEACNPNELFTSEAEEIVNRTLASLPEQTRRIFTMSRYDELTYKMISEELGISIKRVEYHISAALKKFHKNLKDYITAILILLNLI